MPMSHYTIWFTLILLFLFPASILASLVICPTPPKRHQLRKPR